MLDKHWDGGFLPVGWHKVTITDAVSQDFSTGSKGVDYMLQSETGAKGKVRFVLVDSILWRLADFLRTCGVTREQASKFNEQRIDHHRRIIGKMVQVEVVLGPPRGDPPRRYSEVEAWLPMSESTPVDQPTPEHVELVTEDKADDIPF
ncbi:hypothetical protein LCGC14_1435600 [marine sediment metagenome]|uniref:DUF669 domain-containing protein n=1 Tax=marine sediment metagenome TaxID=412755 RepID=A0A0F9M2S7_9ZZZZ